jgi:uncharacterized protein YdhG (YjbR/CyaY superfamily)
MESRKFKTVDEYIGSFPAGIQARLVQLRSAIRKAAPKADEVIAYNMPGYRQDGIVIYFSAYKNHIGLYPRPAEFKKELARYDGAKGTIKIPHDEPLPLKLVGEMVKSRVIQNKKAANGKK